VPCPLRTNSALDFCCNVIIARAVAQQFAQIKFGGRKQAGSELTIGCQSYAIAVAAEWFGNRRNNTNRSLPI
jgi:hypothetical protein